MMQKVVGIPRWGQLRRWGIADVGEGKGAVAEEGEGCEGGE